MTSGCRRIGRQGSKSEQLLVKVAERNLGLFDSREGQPVGLTAWKGVCTPGAALCAPEHPNLSQDASVPRAATACAQAARSAASRSGVKNGDCSTYQPSSTASSCSCSAVASGMRAVTLAGLRTRQSVAHCGPSKGAAPSEVVLSTTVWCIAAAEMPAAAPLAWFSEKPGKSKLAAHPASISQPDPAPPSAKPPPILHSPR
eukprot:scaffold789_cov125-Isochrysis_galbana.AAC.3